MMTPEQFERAAQAAERQNRGWIYGRDVPRCHVIAEGKTFAHVAAVHRRTGRLRIYDQPLKLDKHRKYVLSRTVRVGDIELKPF